jgi:hypothetical protein
MSIQLGIKWEDGRYECPGVGASQSTARYWAELGRELNLELISQIEFNGWPEFDPKTLAQLIREFGILKARLEELQPGPTPKQSIESLERSSR